MGVPLFGGGRGEDFSPNSSLLVIDSSRAPDGGIAVPVPGRVSSLGARAGADAGRGRIRRQIHRLDGENRVARKMPHLRAQVPDLSLQLVHRLVDLRLPAHQLPHRGLDLVQ